jgi:hypothetical protein
MTTAILRSSLLALIFAASFASADHSDDSAFGQIKKIDLSDEGKSNPDHILMALKLNKVRAGMLGQVTIYQFSKRVRIDFDGGLPKGEYTLAVANNCSAKRSAFKDLHKFTSNSSHVQTEKSLPGYSLFPMDGHTALVDKSLALFRKTPAQMIDCETIKNSAEN